MVRLVKLRCQRALGNGHADGVGQTLSQRSGGGFHARRVANFRVTWRLRMELTEVL